MALTPNEEKALRRMYDFQRELRNVELDEAERILEAERKEAEFKNPDGTFNHKNADGTPNTKANPRSRNGHYGKSAVIDGDDGNDWYMNH